jgi:hypothetical protein
VNRRGARDNDHRRSDQHCDEESHRRSRWLGRESASYCG